MKEILNDFVLVEKIPTEPKRGVKNNAAKVIAVGPDCAAVKPGDIVLLTPGQEGTPFNVLNKKLFTYKPFSIHLILNDINEAV